jgi:hypothetical protein
VFRFTRLHRIRSRFSATQIVFGEPADAASISHSLVRREIFALGRSAPIATPMGFAKECSFRAANNIPERSYYECHS